MSFVEARKIWVSYGGTSVVTLLAGFGILMALYSHRKLISS